VTFTTRFRGRLPLFEGVMAVLAFQGGMLFVREFHFSILVFQDQGILDSPENTDHQKGRANCNEDG
jgi:hypothetical protein